MSALAMILAAAMAVPGAGPEKVSEGKIQKRLDLRGRWELNLATELLGNISAGIYSEEELRRMLRIHDDDGENIQMSIPKVGKAGLVFVPCTATYRKTGDCMEIRFHIIPEKTPAEFRDHIPEGRLILVPCRPCK